MSLCTNDHIYKFGLNQSLKLNGDIFCFTDTECVTKVKIPVKHVQTIYKRPDFRYLRLIFY